MYHHSPPQPFPGSVEISSIMGLAMLYNAFARHRSPLPLLLNPTSPGAAPGLPRVWPACNAPRQPPSPFCDRRRRGRGGPWYASSSEGPTQYAWSWIFFTFLAPAVHRGRLGGSRFRSVTTLLTKHFLGVIKDVGDFVLQIKLAADANDKYETCQRAGDRLSLRPT